MSLSSDLNTVELVDDIDNLLFLCDRLTNRLNQVNAYVDEVKQTWINKRRSIEFESNISPILAQKVSKYNKVLLSVAEKLAIVELQTESLHNLQLSVSNLFLGTNDSSSNSNYPLSKNDSSSQRSIQQRPGLGFQNSLNITATNPSISTFTARNSATLFSETGSIKQSIDQQSAFRRPTISSQPQRSLSQNLLISQTPQKPIINTYKKSTPMSDSLSSLTLNESNTTIGGKTRVRMQLISAGITWLNADIPIVDHPSAFFACNQNPRVAEQFNIMSIEMNNHYNKSVNTIMPLQNLSIGDFCVARFSEDNHWYRARIVLIHGNESILIVFIDYGNSETKPASEIYPLQESFTRLPAMAVACTLAETFPRNENFWTPEATEIFNQLVKNRIVEIQFQQGSGQQWPLHFVKIMLDGQSIVQHPKMSPFITSVRNEQIAMHFNDKLTSMEYILYNVAVVESDIYNGTLP